MRQPLRYQIMLPMLGLMVIALVGVSGLSAYLAAGRAQRQIEQQLREMTRTLDQFRFPLTDAVLRQMRGLSGAEFVLVGDSDVILASSADRAAVSRLPSNLVMDPQLMLHQRIALNGAIYFQTARRWPGRNVNEPSATLHILYPEAGYRQAWTDAFYPPLVVGLVAVVLVAFAAIVVADRVSRPMTKLQAQVIRIAEGQFEPMQLPGRQDEIRDLAAAINRMALMLNQYERKVRQTERLRTLAQLGGGMAHQMRNAATGCRMAIDILASELDLSHDCESLAVARRQLELMERHLQRLLTLGKPPRNVPLKRVSLDELVEAILPLVRPAAVHAGVDLRWERPESPAFVAGDVEGLEQLVINLLLNAIEAAANQTAVSGERVVRVLLRSHGLERVELLVEDSGAGLSETVQDKLCEPFVTAKTDGVGLGLAVAKQVAQQHGGQIGWERLAGWTTFRVDLPRAQAENGCVELTGC
jgi:signal transduction histidine kinase